MNKEPRGIRNNNPGNIKYNGINWAGLSIPPSDGVFCVFTEARYGLRALGKLLRNYNRYYGIRAINGIITPTTLKLWLMVLAALALGLFLGNKIFNRLDAKKLRMAVYGYLLVSGATMVLK